MTNLLQRYNKFLKSSQQTFETNVNLNALCNSRAKITCCWSELIFRLLYADSSMKNVSQKFVSCIHLSFITFALHSTQTTNI